MAPCRCKTVGMDAIDKIEAFLADPDWDAARLAKVAKVPESRISEWRRRKTAFKNIPYGRALARAMGCSLDYLTDPDTGWPPPPESNRILLTDQQRRWLDLCAENERVEPGSATRLLLGRGVAAPGEGTVDPGRRPPEPVPTTAVARPPGDQRPRRSGA